MLNPRWWEKPLWPKIAIAVLAIAVSVVAVRWLADILYYDTLFRVEEINARPADLPDAKLYGSVFTAEQMYTKYRCRIAGERPSGFRLKKFKARYPDNTSAVYEKTLGSEVSFEIFIQELPAPGEFGIKYRK